MIYGYARCSTSEKKQDITRQIRELEEKGVQKIFTEYESGTKTDRKELNALLDIVQENDTIVTTEVSRLARSTKQLIEIFDLAEKKQLRLEIGTLIFDCRENEKTDIMTKAMLQIMGVFAELERNMISDRVRSGIENARSKGKTIGRPKTSIENLPKDFINAYNLVKDNKISVVQACKLADIKKTSYYKYKKILENSNK